MLKKFLSFALKESFLMKFQLYLSAIIEFAGYWRVSSVGSNECGEAFPSHIRGVMCDQAGSCEIAVTPSSLHFLLCVVASHINSAADEHLNELIYRSLLTPAIPGKLHGEMCPSGN